MRRGLGSFFSLRTGLPRGVYLLQAGLVVNAFGNGAANPFLLLYLHDVRGIPLGLAGLVAAANAAAALTVALVSGSLADRRGARGTMVVGLVCSATAFALYPLVREAWQAFPLAILAGAGGGTWLTMQSSLLAALAPAEVRHVAFAQQRVVANVGLGLGGFAGGAIVAVARPETFTRLFAVNAATFLAYAVVLLRWVPSPPRPTREGGNAPGYRRVARDGAFIRFAALNFVFVLAVVSLLNSIFPVFARNQAQQTERSIGIFFLLNCLLIVALQLPIARLVEGRRRMRAFALMGALFACCWLLVAAGGEVGRPGIATVLLLAGVAAMSLGECLYDSVQGPLVSSLAPQELLGRYMAVSGFSWQLGFIAGPALAGFVLAAEPRALWPLMAALCLAGSAYALSLERRLPEHVRWTTRRELPADGTRKGRRTAAPRGATSLRRR